MRNFLSLAAIVTLAAVTMVGSAEAAKRRGSYQTTSGSYGDNNRGTGNDRRAYSRGESSESARANNADPARSYGNYPDWARFAFAGRGNRGGR